MQQRLKSMLIGAAVAAALILPAQAANNDWVTWPTKTSGAHSVKLDDIVGTVRIEVKDSGPVTLNVSGTQQRIKALKVKDDGGTLRITGEWSNESVWDWSNWFNFRNHDDDGKLNIKLVVPKGEEIRIDGLVGDAQIGDTQGPLTFSAAVSNANIGRVGPAKIELAGSGKITFVQVSGDLSMEIAGSGKIIGGNAGRTKVEIAGSGDARIGNIAGGLDIDIAGSGDFSAAKVNGPVDVDIMGAGNVFIGDGLANPLKVDIAGSGDFSFGGTAIDPDIDAFGSGNVKIKAYKGHLKTDGVVDLKIGGDFPHAAQAAEPAKGTDTADPARATDASSGR